MIEARRRSGGKYVELEGSMFEGKPKSPAVRGEGFPTDKFTVADHTHNTGRKVNLPYSDCAAHVQRLPPSVRRA